MSGPLRYQNPELQDMLASNYVAGTLRGRARKRMEALMRDNDTLAGRVRQWESKLQPLHEATPLLPPKPSTWKNIANAINGATDPLVTRLMSRLNFYKYLSGFALTVALVLGVLLGYPGSAPVVPAPINYVAVLKNDVAQPTIVVTLKKADRVLTLDILQKPVLADNQHMQLWAVSRTDGSIKSLGAVKLEKHTETSLTKAQWGLIADAEYLLVSAEKQSAVQVPGTRIVAKGLCVKVEGWKS